jgi:subtilase family serine protease
MVFLSIRRLKIMSTVFSRKKIISILSPVLLSMLAIQAQAKPTLPPGWKATPPIITVSKNGSMQPSGGITPSQIKTFYRFPANQQGAGETIVIVDAFDNPVVESDLGVFSAQYNLPACTTANGCFTKVFAAGTQPPQNNIWGEEMALDVEWAHAIAPQAKIILVEAADDGQGLYDAIAFAKGLKPSTISLSWGGGEFSDETSFDSYFQGTIPIFASSGDSAHFVEYPSASPYVIGTGGTEVTMGSDGTYISETAWIGSGGGVSAYETEPAYQTSYVIPQAFGMRGVPDVSYNSSFNSPFSIYVSFMGGWITVSGTSCAAPQWAALTADMMAAKKGRFNNLDASIYSVAREYSLSLFQDILTGFNGNCGYQCFARSGYDYITGVGTPQAVNLIARFQ